LFWPDVHLKLVAREGKGESGWIYFRMQAIADNHQRLAGAARREAKSWPSQRWYSQCASGY